MRMSCNGCRVLRKGCSEDCSLRPCLQWIKTPESQANATVFLAKFYGRAGLVNLINAGPENLRPEIFRSLIYEACGRIINPIYGSVGLLWSGNWQRVQEAVEAVLAGSPIMQLVSCDDSAAEGHPIMPMKGSDIRHLTTTSSAAAFNHPHRVKTPRKNRFKRTSSGSTAAVHGNENEPPAKFSITGWEDKEEKEVVEDEEMKRAPSHDSFSVETVELALAQDEPAGLMVVPESPEVGLELTLAINSSSAPMDDDDV